MTTNFLSKFRLRSENPKASRQPGEFEAGCEDASDSGPAHEHHHEGQPSSRTDHKIEDFLDVYDSSDRHRPGSRGYSSSKALLKWASWAVQRIDNLDKALGEEKMHKDQLIVDLRKANENLDDLHRSIELRHEIHDEELRAQAKRHETVQTVLIETQQKDVNDMQADHSREVAELTRRHQLDRDETQRRHQDEVNKLKSQMLVTHDTKTSWPDGKLKIRCEDLESDMRRLLSEFSIPAHCDTSLIDPSGFLARRPQLLRFLLQNTIWTVLHEHFFSQPFGFGAFGDGVGKAEMTEVYSAWLSRFNSAYSSDTFDIFYESSLASEWRSVTFLTFTSDMIESLALRPAKLPATTRIEQICSANSNSAMEKILAMLGKVAVLSGKTVGAETRTGVRSLVYAVLEISLQFGINSARLNFLKAEHNQEVVLGPDFQIANASRKAGEHVVVDLYSWPGLQRFGDGKVDFSVRKTIFPCKVCPSES